MYGPAKRWPAEHFAAVARHYLEAGWRVWLVGSAKDAPVTAAIAALADGCVDLAGRTDLGQACDLIAAADQVARAGHTGQSGQGRSACGDRRRG